MDSIKPIILQLPEVLASEIHSIVADVSFSWEFFPQVVSLDPTGIFFQFVHKIVDNEKITDEKTFTEVCKKIIDFIQINLGIKVLRAMRIKANLMVKSSFTDSELIHLLHKDLMDGDNEYNSKKKFVSLVYYVEDSDGDTVILDDDKRSILKRSSPIKGNFVLFDSTRWHRSTPPKLNKRRVIINFILEVDRAIDTSKLDLNNESLSIET
jgi:hypothetical protein